MRRSLSQRRWWSGSALSGVLALSWCAPAAAHPSAEHYEPHNWWLAWNFDPLIVASLLSLAALYGWGLNRIWRRGGVGRGISQARVGAFIAAWMTLVAALVSPIDVLSDELSSVHMIQHMLLMMVAAPLFVLGAPSRVILQSMPFSRGRRALAQRSLLRRLSSWWYVASQPLLLWVLYAFILWIWHLPALYQAALRDPTIHDLQHLTFFVGSCLFWWVLFDPVGRMRMSRGMGVLYLFTTSLHASVLGTFMALAARPWYDDYVSRTAAWGLTPLEDQQLAGMIMWMPACSIYAVAAAAVFILWLEEPRQSPAPRKSLRAHLPMA